MNQQAELVTTILAVGSVVAPVVFGFVLWKMSQIFVTNREFGEFKQLSEQRRLEQSVRLENIEANTIKLLQRTARMASVDQ